MPRIVIVKTGSTMPHLAARRGDYEDWIAEGLEVADVSVCRVVDGDTLPDPQGLAGIVVTGSSALVTDRAPWSERTGAWLAAVARSDVPTLAICYGHQLLADTLGGDVGSNTNGREMGTIEVSLTEEAKADPLFEVLPEVVHVSSSHRQAVHALPPGATPMGVGRSEPNQAYRIGGHIWSVQFHPEWDADVMTAYLEARVEILADEGFDPQALLDGVKGTDHGPRLLRRFGELTG